MRLKSFLSLAFFVFLLCVLFRLYYPFVLSAYPQYFYNQAPLLNTHDGYFYAQGAKELLKLYQEFQQSFALEFGQSPIWHLPNFLQDFFTLSISSHLPLYKSTSEILSILTAFLTLCLPFNLEQVLFILPAIFGSLIVFPLMALTRNFGAIPCALSGFLSAMSVSYYNRTMFGYYDTDMLVIVLGLSIGVIILRTLRTQKALDFAILFSLSAFSLLYYSHLRYVLLGYLLILLCFFLKDLYNKSSKESPMQWIILGLFFILTLVIFFPKFTWVWIFLGFFLGFFLDILHKTFPIHKILFFLYFLCNLSLLLWKLLPNFLQSHYLSDYLADTTNIGLHYLNVLDSIAEVSNIDFSEFAYRISGGIFWFILAILGYFGLIFKDKRFTLFLPFLALGCFALLQGLSFIFYAVPISALGMGFLFFKIQTILVSFQNRILKSILLACLVLLVIAPHLWHIRNYVVAPILEASEAEILLSIPAKKGDFALTWWDYGYYVHYFSDLQTFVDGGRHSGIQNFPISLALSTNEERISYNLAKMLLTGETLESHFQTFGIPKTLENLKNKQKWEYSPHALYFILPWRMLEIFPNVMRFSQVDLSNGKPQKLDFFALSLEVTKDRIYFKNNIALNPNTGEVTTQDLHFRIFKSIDLKQHTTQIFDTQSSLVAILLPNGKTLLCAKSYLESFYFKGLFFENLDKNLFQKVLKNDKITIYKLL